MDKATRICKICGKEYPYCTTMTEMNGNRWQDVGCCIEHATEYFRQVAIARGELVEEEPKKDFSKEEIVEEIKEDVHENAAEDIDKKIIEKKDNGNKRSKDRFKIV